MVRPGTYLFPNIALFCIYNQLVNPLHSLCSLVVRVPGYGHRGFGFDYRRYQIFGEVRLERGPLSLVSIIVELLKWKVAEAVYETEINGREDPSR
jgi:hypothetical protein